MPSDYNRITFGEPSDKNLQTVSAMSQITRQLQAKGLPVQPQQKPVVTAAPVKSLGISHQNAPGQAVPQYAGPMPTIETIAPEAQIQSKVTPGQAVPEGTSIGLSPAVIDQVMKAEGTSTVQSGRKEYFGFREGDDTGFDKIAGSVKQFGADSEQTKGIVAGLLQDRARRAGALNFTDPGTQAAVLSMAHMRGEGGAQSILRMVAQADKGPVKKVGKLDAAVIESINAMDSEQFQSKLLAAREQYDKAIYGGREDTVIVNGKTQKGNWWDLFGKGLMNRYRKEAVDFSGLSKAAKAPVA